MLQIVRQHKIDKLTSTHPYEYEFSCPLNKDAPQEPQTSSARRITRQANQSHKSWRRRRIELFRLCPPGTTFMHMSVGLSTEGTHPEVDLHTAWYNIEFDFFFDTTSGL
jgi:hypothetical protein